ncbi:transposase [Dyadobacter sp. NIV53]|uniref:transposase n=1 Tax=Dyadobacter sp. NIV53 TaxID=2861765 RepID=UPI001C8890FF|nr:transposase [Dyadobacter sp. NIV53]
MEKKTASRKRRKYDENYKQEILKMINSGRSVPEVARTMGLGENLVYRWKAESRTQENPEEKSVNSELDQLRKQIRQLETERDILKKALVIFGRGT